MNLKKLIASEKISERCGIDEPHVDKARVAPTAMQIPAAPAMSASRVLQSLVTR
jgi:hypothetical protein